MAIFNEAQFLAYELTTALKDKKHFGFYCMLAKKYPKSFLRKILSEVQQSENWPKVKNRGAFFTRYFFNFLEKTGLTFKKDKV